MIRDKGKVTRRELPAGLVKDFESGLRRFFRLRVRNRQGEVVVDRFLPFCPNAGERARVGDGGPDVPRYPWSCGGHPYFTLGSVWGIDADWAVGAFGFDYWSGGGSNSMSLDVPDGRYSVRLAITHRYARLFDVDPDRRVVKKTAVVETVDDDVIYGHSSPLGKSSSVLSPARYLRGLLEDTTRSDLASLPAFGMSVQREEDKDYLAFSATVWNAGPSPLVVEGFRRPGEDVMDAYQYFYRDGKRVGRSRVGELEFDRKDGHHHWHFKDFARYSLLDSTKSERVRSQKEAFCLAPTDAVDLTRHGAAWRPGSIGLEGACGSSGSIWIREVLEAGWGDTYSQFVAGQSFDITDVPNGTYYVEVMANPDHHLRDGTASNDVAHRKVILGGTPGDRTVKVPRYRGIDTEVVDDGGFTCPPFCNW